jgi:hypothetical protein
LIADSVILDFSKFLKNSASMSKSILWVPFFKPLYAILYGFIRYVHSAIQKWSAKIEKYYRISRGELCDYLK